MDVEKALHMTGGVGKTSYAKNSSLQKKESDKVKHIIIQTVEELYLATTPKSIGIADLGCSSGPNTLSIIKDIFQAIQGISHRIMHHSTEFRVYFNDLPTNDFNSIFKAIPEFQNLLRQDRKNGFPSIFMGGYPGSFYGRLFPNSYLHFVHSSYSLHWLSRVPPALYDEHKRPLNKGCVYICESSPEVVSQAYYHQFQEDFSLFLRSRSEELVVGGRMVLIFLGRRGPEHVDRGNSFFWEILSRSFAILVSQGEIEQEKFDSYDAHFYAPSREEIEEEVRKEGSLKMERLEMFEMDKSNNEQESSESYGTQVAVAVRAIQESMISHHFGEGILESLFENYARLVDEEMAKEDIRPISFVLVLRKI
ncbi:salicylic acid methyl transferase-like protein [Glycine max]|uniref:Salicylic acid methyl transferase-like protein n=1 Tax=Glycine max TaxID=3847 RepID=B5A7G4_SOYBN|nr:salicylic acid methyl transferase-like protein [Glycine max]ACF33513.1 salicylic acid methyl transferase-like protein [Glycine max]|eukprot:NP_001237105.1 salicylic acid methyl transferase-like protein [Glycine max]